MSQDRRGFRFPFSAPAELAPEDSPSATISVRTTELSLHGCALETPSPFAVDTPVLVKIFHEDLYFEAKATVIYVIPSSAMGLTFRDIKPHCRAILQRWILAALQNQMKTG